MDNFGQAPLAGTLILGLTDYGAGPMACSLLAGFGARIVKIESPRRGGDSGRTIPPLAIDGDSPFFQQTNLGCESVCLDVATPEGRCVLERLVRQADGLLTNFRPRAVEHLGLTYAALAPVNSRLVVCALSAYGRRGPLADAPGYDYALQARYGNMALTGSPDGPPTRSGCMFVDMLGAALAALSLSAALHLARATGHGCEVDTSLMEAAVWGLGYFPAWMTSAGFRPARVAWSAHPSVVPSRLFATSDGYVMLMCQTEAFWRKLCDCLGRPDLCEAHEFATMSKRLENKGKLEAILEEIFRNQTTAQWLAVLGDEVPVAPVNSPEQVLTDPQVVESGLLQPVEHPVFDGLKLIMPPFTVNGERPMLRRAPRLGEHTRSVLQELAGLSSGEVNALVRQGVAVETSAQSPTP